MCHTTTQPRLWASFSRLAMRQCRPSASAGSQKALNVSGNAPTGTAARAVRRGAAAVELALVLPFLLLLTLGTIDFGRFAYTWITVANASRSAAGYAVLHPVSPSSQATWQAEIRQTAQLELEGIPGFNANQLTINVETLNDGWGRRRVRVAVTYPFTTLMPWGVIPSQVALQQSTTMPVIR